MTKPLALKRNVLRAFHQPGLTYFLVVAEYLSIREASRRLNVASSAITRQIMQLEEALGVELFARRNQRVHLTAAGEILYRHGQRSLFPLELAVSEIELLQGLHAGRVRVGAAESIALSSLPRLLAEFGRQHPDVSVEAIVASSAAIHEMLLDDRIDMGLCFVTHDDERIDRPFETEVPIGVVMSPTHPLASATKLSLSELLSHPLAVAKVGISYRDVIEDALSTFGRLPPFLETDSIRLLADLVMAGHHAAIMTPVGIQSEIDDGRLIFRTMTKPLLPTNRLSILSRAGGTLELAPRMFLQLACDHFASAHPKHPETK